MIETLRNKLAKKDFDTALLYLQLEREPAALVYFETIINDYYDTEYIDESLLNVALIKKKIDQSLAESYLINNKDYFTSDEKFELAFNTIKNN